SPSWALHGQRRTLEVVQTDHCRSRRSGGVQGSHKEATLKHIWGLLGVLLVPLTAAAQGIGSKAVEGLVEKALKAFQVPGADVAIVQGDRVVYLKGHGVRKLGGDRAVTPTRQHRRGAADPAPGG